LAYTDFDLMLVFFIVDVREPSHHSKRNSTNSF
jgi:hypothetical protein